MFCFHCFTADLTPWSWFSRKNIIYNFNFELFLFCFFRLNWSKANTINVIKPQKSGKELIGLKITHKSGMHWWNHFLKQFRKCLYRHLAVKEKFLCQVHEFEVKTYWRSLGWTWPELTSHKSDSMAFAVTYCHFFEMLVTWAWKRNKFIRIGWSVVCTYQLLYDKINYWGFCGRKQRKSQSNIYCIQLTCHLVYAWPCKYRNIHHSDLIVIR